MTLSTLTQINLIFSNITLPDLAQLNKGSVGFLQISKLGFKIVTGDDDFRKGMNLYLTRHQYKNTFTEDLWAALEEASKKPVGKLMSTWTKQMGFPVVKVVSKPSPDGNGLVLTVTQNKYCGDGSPPPEGYQWLIPITIATSKNPRQKVVSTVLSAKQADIIVPDVGPKDWIKVGNSILFL